MKRQPDPTPEQIREECEEIQKTWTPAERERAEVQGVQHVVWEFKAVVLRRRLAAKDVGR